MEDTLLNNTYWLDEKTQCVMSMDESCGELFYHGTLGGDVIPLGDEKISEVLPERYAEVVKAIIDCQKHIKVKCSTSLYGGTLIEGDRRSIELVKNHLKTRGINVVLKWD